MKKKSLPSKINEKSSSDTGDEENSHDLTEQTRLVKDFAQFKGYVNHNFVKMKPNNQNSPETVQVGSVVQTKPS